MTTFVKLVFAFVLFTYSIGLYGQTDLWIYPFPSNVNKSPDYKIFISNGSTWHESFEYYNYAESSYKKCDDSQCATTTNISTVQMDYRMDRQTWTSFSFENGPVIVKIEVLTGAHEITLPLTGAKILPASLGIDCQIEGENTIVFTLSEPEKVAVICNYEQALLPIINQANQIKHLFPVNSWEETAASFPGQPDHLMREGFANPVFIFAHPEETEIPDSLNENVLVIDEGDQPSPETLNLYDTLYFKAGEHDFSSYGTHPLHLISLKEDQCVYLEGGAYVNARFKGNSLNLAKIFGRGTLSGEKFIWVQESEQIENANVEGITMVENSSNGISGADEIRDIAITACWHGNNGGIDLRDCLVEDVFLNVSDDNIRIWSNGILKHAVLWQNPNAHPIMVQANASIDFSNSQVEDVDIINYEKEFSSNQWALASSGALASVRAGYSTVSDFTFKDIRIESPYLFRVIDIYNFDTDVVTASWFSPTSETNHSRLSNFYFQNITVNTPIIYAKSIVASDYANSLDNVVFNNLIINGVLVTEENKGDYFELPFKNAENISFIQVTNINYPLLNPSHEEKISITLYPNPTRDNTSVNYDLPWNANVSMNLYNILGYEVSTIMNNEFRFRGFNEEIINIINKERLFSGVYFLIIKIDGIEQIRLIKKIFVL